MKNIDLFYKNYHSLNEGKTNDVYYSLLDEIISSEEMNMLYPSDLTDKEIANREPFQYLLLWDRLFYGNYTYDENKIWKDNNHKERCINRLKKVLKWELDEYLKDILFSICYHWPEIRDLIYSDDKKSLKECKTADDYKKYIDDNPNTYKEYRLAAQYKYSILEKSVFSEATEAVKLFPNSKLIDVEDIKQRCVEINEFQVMFNDEVLIDNNLKTFLISFISSFAKIELNVENSVIHIINHYISKEDYLRIMNSYNYSTIQSIITDKSESQIGTLKEFTEFANRLVQLTGLKFQIPDINTLSMSTHQSIVLRQKCTDIFKVDNIGEWALVATRPKLIRETCKNFIVCSNQTFGVCRLIIES